VTRTATPNVIAGLAARLTDSQDREAYAALVSYVNELPPDDEFAKVAKLLGFFTLMSNNLPEALADEARAIRLLSERIEKANAALDERLSKLPSEIAVGVDPAAIAKEMSHSFRQQLSHTALHETASLMKAAVITLKGLNAEVATNLKPLTVELSENTTRLLATLKQVNELEPRPQSRASNSGTLLQAFLFFAVFVAGGVAGYLLHH